MHRSTCLSLLIKVCKPIFISENIIIFLNNSFEPGCFFSFMPLSFVFWSTWTLDWLPTYLTWTIVDIWQTTYLPHLVHVVCERPQKQTLIGKSKRKLNRSTRSFILRYYIFPNMLSYFCASVSLERAKYEGMCENKKHMFMSSI